MFNIAHGQNNERFERFNDLINKPANYVESQLKGKFKIKRITRFVKSDDSVRLVFNVRSPKQKYTLFVVSDTLRYIGTTFFKMPTPDLRHELLTRYVEIPLDKLRGDIFEHYSNAKHYAHAFFTDRETKFGYLLVVYPELDANHSNIVVWIRAKH